MTDAYPLQWPPGWKRTIRPQRSNFGEGRHNGSYMTRIPLTHSKALSNLINELDRLGVKKQVLSTNLELRLDGLPRSGQRRLEDNGVAIYFELDGKEQCIPCDKWDRVEDNMQAVAKTIEALRGIERWGAKEMVDAAFRGFQALPDYHTPGTAISMGIRYFDDSFDIKKRYKELVKTLHPDVGGDITEFQEMQRQYKEKSVYTQ